MKKYSTIHPTMFRALSNLFEDEKEYNDKIIETGIVPPTKLISGSGEINIPSICGSVWSLNHEYITKQLYDPHEIHSILKKKINMKCEDGKIEITDPKGCYIEENDLEGVMIVCTQSIKFDSAEITGNPVINKEKRRFNYNKEHT